MQQIESIWLVIRAYIDMVGWHTETTVDVYYDQKTAYAEYRELYDFYNTSNDWDFIDESLQDDQLYFGAYNDTVKLELAMRRIDLKEE